MSDESNSSLIGISRTGSAVGRRAVGCAWFCPSWFGPLHPVAAAVHALFTGMRAWSTDLTGAAVAAAAERE
jgi:hypothetical protein